MKKTASSQQLLDQDLSSAIQKLEQLDTAETGFKEAVKIFGNYHSETHVRSIVSKITQVLRNKHSENLLKENVIVMIGVFVNHYKERAIGVCSQLVRLTMKGFELKRESLQQSCARTLKEIYQHVLINQTTDTKTNILYSSLADYLLSAPGAMAQSGCSLAIYELLLFFTTADAFEDFHLLADRVLAVSNKLLIKSEEVVAIRRIIIENAHDGLLAKHTHLDKSEFLGILGNLASKSDNTKLDMQIKSELIALIEAWLSRPVLKNRLDLDTISQVKKLIESSSFSRLPRVRSAAKILRTKLNQPEGIERSGSVPKFAKPLQDSILTEQSQSQVLRPSGVAMGSSVNQEQKESIVSQAEVVDQIKANESSQFPKFTLSEAKGDQSAPPVGSPKSIVHPSVPNTKYPAADSVSAPSQPSALLQARRDQLKQEKRQEIVSTSPPSAVQNHSDLKRGLYLVDGPLLPMTQGKGWAPNVRAKNFLRRGNRPGDSTNDLELGDRLKSLRETRNKQRMEYRGQIGRDRSSGSRGKNKFGGIDEEAERKRKRRLYLISKGLNPDDDDVEDQLKNLSDRGSPRVRFDQDDEGPGNQSVPLAQLLKPKNKAEAEKQLSNRKVTGIQLNTGRSSKEESGMTSFRDTSMLAGSFAGKLKVKRQKTDRSSARGPPPPPKLTLLSQEASASLLTGADGSPRALPANTKVVSFKRTDDGTYVDEKGDPVQKELLLSMYKENDKGELVDEQGEVVQSVQVLVEQPLPPVLDNSEDVSEVLEEGEGGSQSQDMFGDGNMTVPFRDDEAEEIALNKAMERIIKKFGEDAVNVENIWAIFLELLEEENYSKAFEVLLRFGDDFYFLRACLMTGGSILKKLHKRVAQRVVRKLAQIRLAGNMDTIFLHFMERGIKNNYLDQVSFQATLDTQDSLKYIASNYNLQVKDKANYLHKLVNKLMQIN